MLGSKRPDRHARTFKPLTDAIQNATTSKLTPLPRKRVRSVTQSCQAQWPKYEGLTCQAPKSASHRGLTWARLGLTATVKWRTTRLTRLVKLNRGFSCEAALAALIAVRCITRELLLRLGGQALQAEVAEYMPDNLFRVAA
jgi:hypothetical protein